MRMLWPMATTNCCIIGPSNCVCYFKKMITYYMIAPNWQFHSGFNVIVIYVELNGELCQHLLQEYRDRNWRCEYPFRCVCMSARTGAPLTGYPRLNQTWLDHLVGIFNKQKFTQFGWLNGVIKKFNNVNVSAYYRLRWVT